jgi:galactokinase/mevalonate kinase-like predicted kinase
VNELEASLLLFNTEVSRDSEAIIAEQTSGVANHDPRSIEAMQSLKQEVVENKRSYPSFRRRHASRVGPARKEQQG